MRVAVQPALTVKARNLGGHLTLASTVLVALTGFYVTMNRALNLDVGFFLLAARAISDGRGLYVSFPDYSMPTTTWLAWMSLQTANMTGLLLADVHQAVLCALTVTGAGLTGFLIYIMNGPGSLSGRLMPPIVMGLFLLVPGYDSGQRDVLFTVLAAPLAAVVVARHYGISPCLGLSVAIVALAAVGSSFKPHYLLTLLVIGICDVLLRRGRLRQVAPELWALAAVLTGYVALIHVLYPTYFFQVLPTAARFYAFQAWIVSLLLVLRVAAGALVVAAILLAAITRNRLQRHRPVPWGLMASWVAVGGSLFVEYYVQHTGFRYHRVPLLLFALVSVALFALLSIEIGLQRWAERDKCSALAWLRGSIGLPWQLWCGSLSHRRGISTWKVCRARMRWTIR